MHDELSIIHYPDPRLRKPSQPVTTFDDGLKKLAARMLELMREANGVGLAAPQVGLGLRLFVMNATGEPGDDRVYVNPELIDGDGTEEGEEGCLSIPGVNVKILRDKKLRILAKDLDGNPVDESASGFVARVWQHETDHLNGTLITDRMGAVAKMAYKKKLKELEEEFTAK
ncbi:MAG TPA: peptide deformylase [Tepidisphaeraceae bacterium]|nr:peptide deformylase [Tepidisphaeraceae bacterium]